MLAYQADRRGRVNPGRGRGPCKMQRPDRVAPGAPAVAGVWGAQGRKAVRPAEAGVWSLFHKPRGAVDSYLGRKVTASDLCARKIVAAMQQIQGKRPVGELAK